jgi:ubiquinone/menaquinone biosynthesis C-methylase UbiE
VTADSAFVGSIPALYDLHLGPLLFEPYAADIAARARTEPPRRVLEIAAGTGIVTRALHDALPDAEIVATDLNEAMIAHGRQRLGSARVSWRQADAMALPFADGEFDLVVCQFGVMFFPDRARAFREAWRVLRPGGRSMLSVWASLEHNLVPQLVARAVAAAFPDDPPQFLERTPYGHGDAAVTEAELRAAGFSQVGAEVVERTSRAPSAATPAIGFCQGTPVRMEIEARDASRLSDVTEAATRAVAQRFGPGPIEASHRANVFVATK